MARRASTRGRLLVATPLLGDPNFERTVIFMLEDNDDGALGLVLNRPSPLEVDRAVAGLVPVGRRAVGRVRRRPGVTQFGDRARGSRTGLRSTGRCLDRSRRHRRRPRPDRRRRPHRRRPRRGPGLRRLRGMGRRPARAARSTRARGSSSTPSRPTRSPTGPTSCGVTSCAANPILFASSRTIPRTRRSTDRDKGPRLGVLSSRG